MKMKTNLVISKYLVAILSVNDLITYTTVVSVLAL